MVTISLSIPALILNLVLSGPAQATSPASAAGPPGPGPERFTIVFSLVQRPGRPPAPTPPPALPPPSPRPAPSPVIRRPLTAAAEVAGLNLGVWAFLQYVSNADYSYISAESMLDNVRDGWEWDRSRYYVNFYHHPYHGYLYYNAGRANGLGYWGSSLCALGGSFMWEMMMEKYRPSYNDLATTTCGGIVYGEIGYRFSALIRKRGAHGLGRIWRETLGAIFDPVGGANRLLDGRSTMDPGLPGAPDSGRILNGELLVTGPVVTRSAELTGTRTAPLIGFTLRYGDAAGTGWTGRPFDVFTVSGRLRWGPDRPHMSLFIHGALFGRPFGAARPGATSPGLSTDASSSSHFLGFYQHYEYYGLETMRLAGTSFTGGWTSRFVFRPGVRLTTSARLGWLGLGASDDFLGEIGARRAYNLATGITAAAEVTIGLKDYDYFSLIWRHYGLFDLDVIGSRVGRETWDILQGQFEVPIWSTFGIGFEAEFCSRRFNFRDFPSGDRSLVEARAFIDWQF